MTRSIRAPAWRSLSSTFPLSGAMITTSFEQADLFSNLNENRFHLVQYGVPVAIFVGPGEQYAVLFFPFGR